MHSATKLFAALMTLGFVSAHGALVAVTGANGVVGQGFGIDAATPRDGSRRNPFQQDTSIIRTEEIEDGEAGVCGRTLGGGNNNVPAQMAAAVAAGLPAAAADGTITMTLHQINGDGAGPYSCQISADGTGADFVTAAVVQNVPGENSRSRARATPFPLTVQMPANMACTGGPNGDACLVRCMNGARAGPFGGCAAVTGPAAAAAAAGAVAATSAAAATAAATTVAAAGAAAATLPAAGAAAATASVAEVAGAVAGTASVAAVAETASVAAVAAGTATAVAAAAGTATAVGVAAAETTGAGVAAVGAGGAAAASGVAAAGKGGAGNVSAAEAAAAGADATLDDPMDFKMRKRFMTSRIVGAKRTGKWL